MGAFTSSSNPFSSLASRPEFLWYPFRCSSSSFCLYFVFSCSSSPLMNSSKQMIFKLCLFQETYSFIWRVYKNLLHWGGTYIPINAHLAGALILRNAARRMRGCVCYCLQGCPIFSDLDLGNLDFWGSIYVFNSNSFWKQVSLSVMTTVLEKDFFFVGQQKKAASASQFPPAVWSPSPK